MDGWEVHAPVTHVLDRWGRLRRVWTLHGRGSAAIAYLKNIDFLPVEYRGDGHCRIMAKHGVGVESLFLGKFGTDAFCGREWRIECL